MSELRAKLVAGQEQMRGSLDSLRSLGMTAVVGGMTALGKAAATVLRRRRW